MYGDASTGGLWQRTVETVPRKFPCVGQRLIIWNRDIYLSCNDLSWGWRLFVQIGLHTVCKLSLLFTCLPTVWMFGWHPTYELGNIVKVVIGELEQSKCPELHATVCFNTASNQPVCTKNILKRQGAYSSVGVN